MVRWRRSVSLGGAVAIAVAALALQVGVAAAATMERIGAPNRYSTSAAIAREFFDPAGDKSWPGVSYIIVASGEDAAMADALAASGLSGAYDAPLLLARPTGFSAEAKAVIQEIVAANTTVTVLPVGGSVGEYNDPVMVQIKQLTGRDPFAVWGADRYAVGAETCNRIWARRSGDMSVAFVVNAQDPSKFYDALSASAVAANQEYPILYVKYDSIPQKTLYMLQNKSIERVIIVGGPGSVSSSVMTQIDALPGIRVERWAGADRYTTATTFANKALAEGWCATDTVGVAAKVPDALTGGTSLGKAGGVFLPVGSTTLPNSIRHWLEGHAADVDRCYVFGQADSVSGSVYSQVSDALK